MAENRALMYKLSIPEIRAIGSELDDTTFAWSYHGEHRELPFAAAPTAAGDPVIERLAQTWDVEVTEIELIACGVRSAYLLGISYTQLHDFTLSPGGATLLNRLVALRQGSEPQPMSCLG